MGVRVIAGLTCREAVRRKVLLATGVVGSAFLALYGLGVYLILRNIEAHGLVSQVEMRQGSTALMLMGMYAVNWLLVVLTILISVDTLAGEINSGTIQSVVTKPVRRWQVVAGKWIGFAAMLTPFLLLMAAGVVSEIYLLTGQLPASFVQPVALMWLESMLLLAVSFRAGSSLGTLATGVVVFGLHLLAFVGGWVEEFGSMAQSSTAVSIGVVVSLIMPSEALWRRAASELQGAIIGGFGRGPFNVASVPSVWMVVYAAAYLLAALSLAMRRFSKRDL